MTLLTDACPIEKIRIADTGRIFRVGRNECTAIRVSSENGEMGCVPWFAIYTNDEMLHRVNSKYVELVEYKSLRKD